MDDEKEVFVADVHRDQRVWTEDPGLHGPEPKSERGRVPKKRQAARHGGGVGEGFTAQGLDAPRLARRHARSPSSRYRPSPGWVWDGEEERPRCWHPIVRREVNSPKTIKYSLSNAPADTSTLRLARIQGDRFWVERAFEDAKGECGLADYQALGWRSWHHHVTIVMLAMVFICEQRVALHSDFKLSTPRDIVEMLKESLPRKPEGKEALVDRINQRHKKRQGAIVSRDRAQHRLASR